MRRHREDSPLLDADWRTSSHSASGHCVEVGVRQGNVMVRDSKDASGPALVLSPDGWTSFVLAVARGEFPVV